MNETLVNLIYLAAGVLLGMVIGWLLHTNRNLRLAKDSGVYDNLTRDIKDSTERVENLEDKLGGLVEAGRDVEAIISKYSAGSAENKDVE